MAVRQSTMQEKITARDEMVALVRQLLIGPLRDDAQERLASDPLDTYLTGILWPKHTEISAEEDDQKVADAERDTDADEKDWPDPKGISTWDHMHV